MKSVNNEFFVHLCNQVYPDVRDHVWYSAIFNVKDRVQPNVLDLILRQANDKIDLDKQKDNI